jgi:hypothetical protein
MRVTPLSRSVLAFLLSTFELGYRAYQRLKAGPPGVECFGPFWKSVGPKWKFRLYVRTMILKPLEGHSALGSETGGVAPFPQNSPKFPKFP